MNKTEIQNFGLTEAEFSELILKLQHGDESLFEHAFLQHFADCRAYLVREDGASEDIAYDATMDAFLAFRESLGRGKVTYGNLRYLLTRMARQRLYKRLNKEKSVSLEGEGVPEPVEEMPIDDSSMELLQGAWRGLGAKCKNLLRRVYYGNVPMIEIARLEGRKEEAVRKQKERCVKKLRSLV